ncbi:CheY chemotaxis protein or a CheY-like REC (receiver) domain [Devosia crocina]|uniref:CheY chemotaxis protein or a CheY-like REC (Receiver) domain n=1 Tax=Devosia crocina TaxID=429728 RepID=A0A1I7NRG8_9HYPH|nr:response regulator [Devosia crocina]SFV37287.1 CheY chemotaxis protein or a CheY-like REC (receiver) domain [Devosia crocina]
MDFSGKRILVVEDDYYLAHDLCDDLRRHHATVLGPAPTPFYASSLMTHRKIDGAVLDIMLHRDTVYDLADKLLQQGTPVVFASALGNTEIPGRFRDLPHLQKPFSVKDVLGAVEQMVFSPRHHVPAAAGPIGEASASGSRPLMGPVVRAMEKLIQRRLRARDSAH